MFGDIILAGIMVGFVTLMYLVVCKGGQQW